MNIQYNMKIQDYLPITLGVKSLDFKHMHNMQNCRCTPVVGFHLISSVLYHHVEYFFLNHFYKNINTTLRSGSDLL